MGIRTLRTKMKSATTTAAAIALLVLAAPVLAAPRTSKAQKPDFFRFCLAQAIEYASDKNYWIDARSVRRTCACFINRQEQGLNTGDCPSWNYREN